MTVFLAIVGLAVLVMAIKFTIRRRRPDGEWGGLYRSTDPHSFPSGHAARAVLIAVLAIGLGPAWLAILLAFGCAFATGLVFGYMPARKAALVDPIVALAT